MNKLQRKLKRLEELFEKTPEKATLRRARILRQAEKVTTKLEELKRGVKV